MSISPAIDRFLPPSVGRVRLCRPPTVIRLAAAFGALVFLVLTAAFAVHAGESRPTPLVDRIPAPRALADVPEGERLDHLIARLDEDRVFFNHLLNVYIKIPTLMGQAPVSDPAPDEVLRRLAERRRILEAEDPPPAPDNVEAVLVALEKKPLRQWLRFLGLLAAGKRVMNAGDDGGEEYARFFRYSGFLAKKDPALLFAVTTEFCQFGVRPPRSRISVPVRKGRDSARHFLPALLSADYPVKREPDLARLVPAIISPPLLEEALENVAPEAWASFPALARTSQLLTGFRIARIGNAPSGNAGVEGFRSLDTAIFVLKSCIGHEAFDRLSEKRRNELRETAAFFEKEAARRERAVAPSVDGNGGKDGAVAMAPDAGAK